MKSISPLLFIVVGACVAFASSTSWADDKLTAEQTDFFETKIRPVLVRECYGCHSTRSGQLKGGLWLDNKDGMRAGGDSGAAIVPGDVDESLLWNAINHEDWEMPPRKKLSDQVIADFRTWIEMGAPDPRIRTTSNVNSSISPEDIVEGKNFWAFKLPEKQTVPRFDQTNMESKNANWAVSDIDRFVLEKLAANGLEPSPDAGAATVLRRLTFDLIGLPPTPEQIATIEKHWKEDPQLAIEAMVDSLLDQPGFGERWGRHWLDVARYAESSGKETNLTYPHAWRYRDYVIDSFNDDKPYDRFVQEQIAGDLLPVKNDDQWSENLIATGFLALGPKTLTERNGRQFELDLIDEQLDVTTRVMLGVSVACARCHDHKFDPIPQTDYYALSGIFRSMTTHYGTIDTFQNRRASNLLILPVDDLSPFDKTLSKREIADLQDQLTAKKNDLRELQRQRRLARMGASTPKKKPGGAIVSVARTSAEVAMLESKINSHDDRGNPYSYCMGVQSADQPVNARLLERGEFDKPAQEVKRGFPQVLGETPTTIDGKSSGRLELARWIGSDENPLTARVMVNRVWQHLLGNGIVRSPENFGATGQSPTHPELLDHLAIEFMEHDWSVKQLVRKIVLSRIYRTSSTFSKSNFEVDPENNYLWRVDPKRLDAEALRDSILAISGNLDQRRPRASIVAEAGAAVVREGVLQTMQTPRTSTTMSSGSGDSMMRGRRNSRAGSMTAGDRAGRRFDRRPGRSQNRVKIDQPESFRSVYLPIVRDNLPRSLEVFDFAEPSMVVGERESSNTPDQGLYFLNNAFVMEQSDAMARRLIGESKRVKDQLENAFLLAYGRPGTPGELRAAATFYRTFKTDSSSRGGDTDETKKLSAVCQAIMASAEFRFVN